MGRRVRPVFRLLSRAVAALATSPREAPLPRRSGTHWPAGGRKNLRASSPPGGEGDPRCPDPGKETAGNLRAARLAAARDALLAMKHGSSAGSRRLAQRRNGLRRRRRSPRPGMGRRFLAKDAAQSSFLTLLPRSNPEESISPRSRRRLPETAHHLRRNQGDRLDPQGKDELRPCNSFAEKDPERGDLAPQDRRPPRSWRRSIRNDPRTSAADRVAPVEGEDLRAVVDSDRTKGSVAKTPSDVRSPPRRKGRRVSGGEEAVPDRNRAFPRVFLPKAFLERNASRPNVVYQAIVHRSSSGCSAIPT